MNFLRLILSFDHVTRGGKEMKFMSNLWKRCRPWSSFTFIYERRYRHTSISGWRKVCWYGNFYHAEYRRISFFFFTRFISISDVIHTDGGFFGIPWVSLEHKCRVLIKFCFWKICSDVRRWVTWTFTRTAVLLCNQDVCKKSYQKIIFWESSVSSRVRNGN